MSESKQAPESPDTPNETKRLTRKEMDEALVQKALYLLREHFDTVQIFVTRHEPNDVGTVCYKHGLGNWFAREGQVRNWLLKQDEGARMEMRPASNDS